MEPAVPVAPETPVSLDYRDVEGLRVVPVRWVNLAEPDLLVFLDQSATPDPPGSPEPLESKDPPAKPDVPAPPGASAAATASATRW